MIHKNGQIQIILILNFNNFEVKNSKKMKQIFEEREQRSKTKKPPFEVDHSWNYRRKAKRIQNRSKHNRIESIQSNWHGRNVNKTEIAGEMLKFTTHTRSDICLSKHTIE